MVSKVRAYVTSIGEKTTELCRWSLERNGFEVVVIEGSEKLAKKLETIYSQADHDFLRVDADVIVNSKCTPQFLGTKLKEYPIELWVQFRTYEWYRQDLGYGGVQYIKKEVLPLLREKIVNFREAERPETELSRLSELYNPRTFVSDDTVLGIHNYKNNLKRVAQVKARRGQSHLYDFELAKRLEEL